MPTAFDPVRVGSWTLPQRFVMAPLTRNRAGHGMAPTAMNAEYYGQRAGAGLIVTEGTQPSWAGQGYLNTPGIHTPDQIEGWRQVARAVHARGGRIVVQLMHAGRIAHPENKIAETVAPSAIPLEGEVVTASGRKPYVTPRALDIDDIPGVVEEFVHAARCAVAAELDGVEIHAANGYLIHQFLAPSANHRTDAYGGTPEKRARFAVEVTNAVAAAIGGQRVGIRISPAHNVQGAIETDPQATRRTYETLLDGIADANLAYLSVLADPAAELTQHLRSRFDGSFIVNSGFDSHTTLAEVETILARDLADVVAVGRPFLANPDLALRWRAGADLNKPDSKTFYGGGAHGYTDYPTM